MKYVLTLRKDAEAIARFACDPLREPVVYLIERTDLATGNAVSMRQ